MKRYNISIFSSFARCISFSGCTFCKFSKKIFSLIYFNKWSPLTVHFFLFFLDKLLSLWMRWNSVLGKGFFIIFFIYSHSIKANGIFIFFLDRSGCVNLSKIQKIFFRQV